MADLEKIETVVKFIEKQVAINPAKFDMSDWGYEDSKCGTVACFAGWAPIAFGERVEEVEYRMVVTSADRNEYGDYQGVSAWTQKALGLTEEEADDIFFATGVKTVDELRELLDEVLGVEVFAG